MKNSREKGKCLNCPRMECSGRVAWCHRENGMRIILETDYTNEEKGTILNGSPKTRKDLQIKQTKKTLEKLAKRVNPSWCRYRKEE